MNQLQHVLPPHDGPRAAMVWDPSRGAATVVQVSRVRDPYLLVWTLSTGGAELAASLAQGDDNDPLYAVEAVAAAYDPGQEAIVVVGLVGDSNNEEANSVVVWTVRGATIERARVFRQTFASHEITACWDGARKRVVVTVDGGLYSLEAKGLAKIATYEHAWPLVPVFDDAGKRLVLVGYDFVGVVEGSKLVELERPEDLTGDVRFAAFARDRGAVYIVSDWVEPIAFELRGSSFKQTNDVIPSRSRMLAAPTQNGFLGLATRAIESRDGTPMVFELTPGAGAKAYREVTLVPSAGRFVANATLVHASEQARISVRDRMGAWTEWTNNNKAPREIALSDAVTQDESGRVIVYSFLGELRAVKNGAWSMLAERSEKSSPGARDGATIIASGNEILLFGGSVHGRTMADTWRFADKKWKQVKTKHVPGKREQASAWSLPNGGMLMCGGRVGDRPLDDIWILHGKDWRNAGRLPREAFGHEGERPRFAATGYEPKTRAPLALSQSKDQRHHVLWRWDGVAWQNVAAIPAPPYDGVLDELVVEGSLHHGGSSVGLDPVTNTIVYVDQRPVARTRIDALPALATVAPTKTNAKQPSKAAAKPARPSAPSTLIRLARGQGSSFSRAGGEPIGMTKETWPMHRKKPMHHVITLSRDMIAVELPAHVAAIAVFISDLSENSASTPSTKETRVVFLSAADVKRGETSAKQIFGTPLDLPLDAKARGIVKAALQYHFDEVKETAASEADLDEDGISSAIQAYVFQQEETKIARNPVLGFSGPHVPFLQDAETPHGLRTAFWFRDELVPGLNCGTGIMYVAIDPDCTTGTAWWQS